MEKYILKFDLCNFRSKKNPDYIEKYIDLTIHLTESDLKQYFLFKRALHTVSAVINLLPQYSESKREQNAIFIPPPHFDLVIAEK